MRATEDIFDTEHWVAKVTGMSLSTVRKWRLLGRGPRYFRVYGRAIRCKREDVFAWMNSQPSGGEACLAAQGGQQAAA